MDSTLFWNNHGFYLVGIYLRGQRVHVRSTMHFAIFDTQCLFIITAEFLNAESLKFESSE